MMVLSSFHVARAIDELPAAFGPPSGSNALSWAFYATPEVQQPTELEIEGNIPSWVVGSLYRGAAATWDVGNFTAEHWFDGFSRNHRWEIANGSVTYRNRNASDELTHFIRETGLMPGGAFGTDPCKIIFGAFEQTFRDGNNTRGDTSAANVNVAFIPNFAGLNRNATEPAPLDTLVASTDANFLQQIDPATLEPIELFKYQAIDPRLSDDARISAHPVLGEDGSVYNYLLDIKENEPPTYRIFGINPEGKATIYATIDDAPAAYIHSLFATEKHLILIVWQADIVRRSPSLVYSLGEWDPNRKSLFYVVDRKEGGIMAKYGSPDAFFAFHSINSHVDEHGDILIDLPRLNDTSFLGAAKTKSVRANIGAINGSSEHDVVAAFARYRLPFVSNKTRTCNGTLITHAAKIDFTLPFHEASIELPRINEAYHGKPYRYAYGLHVDKPGYFVDSVIKVDTKTQTWKTWIPKTNHLPTEPIFVARPGAVDEDDGVLLSVAMDAEAGSSALVFIDARNMEEIARARMPVVMGFSFHGTFASQAQSYSV